MASDREMEIASPASTSGDEERLLPAQRSGANTRKRRLSAGERSDEEPGTPTDADVGQPAPKRARYQQNEPSLLGMPPEIFDEIMSHLINGETDPSWPSLTALADTSKKMRARLDDYDSIPSLLKSLEMARRYKRFIIPKAFFDSISENSINELQISDRIKNASTVVPFVPEKYKEKYGDKILSISNRFRKSIAIDDAMDNGKHLSTSVRSKLLNETIGMVEEINNEIHRDGGVLGRPRPIEHDSFDERHREAERVARILEKSSRYMSDENRDKVERLSDRHAGLTELLAPTLAGSPATEAASPTRSSPSPGQTIPAPRTDEIAENMRDVEGYLKIMENATTGDSYIRSSGSEIIAEKIVKNIEDSKINLLDERTRIRDTRER